MKVSKSKLEQIIREELKSVLSKTTSPFQVPTYLIQDPEGDAIDDEEDIEEVLGPDDDVGDYIDDFSDSNAPSLKGKSKEKRKEMAIAAHYAAKEKDS
tara:strand:+ start:3517 stop:3810 length:294 start_codon:yes stop_codon:yes gene_type:complete